MSFVAVKAQYVNGLEGANLLIVKEEDVKVTDLMMVVMAGNVSANSQNFI